jgi:hypothetical protein
MLVTKVPRRSRSLHELDRSWICGTRDSRHSQVAAYGIGPFHEGYRGTHCDINDQKLRTIMRVKSK